MTVLHFFKESWENGDAWIAWLLLQKELCPVVSQSLLGSFLIQMVKKGHLDTHSTHKNTTAILLHTAVVGGVIFQTNAEMFIFGYLNVEFYVRWGILGLMRNFRLEVKCLILILKDKLKCSLKKGILIGLKGKSIPQGQIWFQIISANGYQVYHKILISCQQFIRMKYTPKRLYILFKCSLFLHIVGTKLIL